MSVCPSCKREHSAPTAECNDYDMAHAASLARRERVWAKHLAGQLVTLDEFLARRGYRETT